MKRREFLNVTVKTAAAGAASTVFAAPTIIHAQAPSIRWQMATSWPVSLDVLYGGSQAFAERVAALTDGKFQITSNPAGKLSKGTDILDVVSQGAVPIGHTASYYYIGKGPATAFGTCVPFGLTQRQQNAWLYDGGGMKLMQDYYAKKFGVIQFPAGNTGTQMGGWFRKEVNTLADLQGLKMRIPGLGGEVMKRLGVTVQTLPGGEIFQALQTGTVDAAEWVGPYDDEKLGFYKVAKFYYYPGWWEPAPSIEIEINLNEWNKLPKQYQEALKSAAAEANINMTAQYDARNAAALKKLQGQGVQVKAFSKEIMDAGRKAALGLYDEFAAKDADFKAIYENVKAFQSQTNPWFGMNEFAYEDYIFNAK